MKYICKRLLEEVTGDKDIYCTHEDEYKRLCKFSALYPDIDIKVEDELIKIEKQWVSIARIIVNECRKDLIVPTLFAATKKIMEIYVKIDHEIPKYHIMWMDMVISELDSRKNSSFFYFLILTMFIFYISK